MPRPKKGVGVLQRVVKVYAEDMNQYERWKKASTESKTPISRFFREIIDSHLAGDWSSKKTMEFEKQIAEIKNTNSMLLIENSKLQDTINRLEANLKISEDELRNLKYGSFLNNNFEGKREFNNALVKLFKEKKRLREEDIISLLHISPDDIRRNEMILNQINVLLDYGLIIRHRGGYEWKK